MPARPDYEQTFLDLLLVLSDDQLFRMARSYVWMAAHDSYREFTWKREGSIAKFNCDAREGV